MFKKVLFIGAVSILPIIFVFLIYVQISELAKTKYDFSLVEGKVEMTGITTKVRNGNDKSPTTASDVLYVKLYSNDTLYSYFNMFRDYSFLKKKLKVDEQVKIFNEGFDIRQNTVDIIQLESNNEVIISKSEFDNRNIVMIVLMAIFLFLYFYIPFRFIVKSNRKFKQLKS